jgi:hypothetical protein
MKRPFLILIVILITYCSHSYGQAVNHWEGVIFNKDIWRYYIGTSYPGQDWQKPAFDDTSWPSGPGGFGYGDNDDNTIIPQCTSVYMRIKFNVTDTSAIAAAILHMDYDDAFIAYLNGKEIARVGMAQVAPGFNDTGDDHEATMYRGGLPESFIIDKRNLNVFMLQGENLLAIEVHNSTTTSTDLSSNAFLSFGIKNSSSYFRPVPSWFIAPFILSSSKLPVVVITTKPGETIKNEPKITADMKIIYSGGNSPNYVSDQGNIYSGKIGIEIRGRYSASLPQKPYGIETRDIAGNNLDVPLLGMPAENDWVLLANYNDKTFLRNYLAFYLWQELGHYATRTRYCEVVVNNDYQGIYLLGEKIKRDGNRVDIAKLNPDEITGDDLTGGYIFKTDYFTAQDSWLSSFSPANRPGASVHFVYYDPKPEELSLPQKSYIKDFVNSFESNLYSHDFEDHKTGYRAYLDVNSFVDYFLLEEITRNVDAYKKSRYFYKDKDSNKGLIRSGPVWDFDWAWKNLTEGCIHFNQADGSGWAYKVNECNPNPVPPSWEVRLMQDADFVNMIHDKYYVLRRTIFSQARINHVIDSVALLLAEAQTRHYQKWKILGINVGTPETGIQPATFEGEIEKFKSWINTRLSWLDKNMVGRSYANKDGYSAICRIFPNPAGENLYVESDTTISRLTLHNYMGTIVEDQKDINSFTFGLNISHLSPGLYIVKIYFAHGEIITRKLVKY